VISGRKPCAARLREAAIPKPNNPMKIAALKTYLLSAGLDTPFRFA
jgi:hypothetical protein